MSDPFAPNTVQEACDVVRDARAHTRVIQIAGNGSKSGIGQLHDVPSVQLKSSALAGIIQYNPAELVIVARAGTSMAEIEAALSEAGQRLAFEPANWSGLTGTKKGQTLGGIAATNMSGPRRFAAGAARDALLGVKFINGRGHEITNGGQVMKNVTGLDLVKLMAGSWGTLGMLSEVSFKVLPVPSTQRTLVLHGLSDEAAGKTMAKAMATSCEVTGAAHLPDAASVGLSGPATLFRLEGLEGSVADRMVRLRSALGTHHDFSDCDATASQSAWAAIRDIDAFCDNTARPVWRLSVPPASGWKVVAHIRETAGCDAIYDWQGGLIWLRMDADDPAAQTVRQAIAAHGGGHATLVRASQRQRRTTPVFQPETAAIAAISKRIRAAMDPDGIFDGGRMMAPDSAIQVA